MIISPSILSCDFLNIEKELQAFTNIENIWIHLDVMDGHFVPNLTFGNPVIKKMVSKFPQLKFDAHFMVNNPEFFIDSLSEVSLQNFTFHYEASLNQTSSLIEKAKKYFPSVGISIKPNTSLSSLSHLILEKIDLLLIMSVEPGFGGQSFIESSYQKISDAKKIREENNFHFQIQVDGGVNSNNALTLKNSGADNLVAGSFIFKETRDNYSKQVSSLIGDKK